MLERRTIRVLVPYSRTLYFNDKGRERDLTADHVRDFERWVNRKYVKQLGKRPLTIYIIPTTRDSLLPDLAKGRGDIAEGNLTVTDERRKHVDFVSSTQTIGKISEVLVTGPKTPPISGVDDLAGKTIHVVKLGVIEKRLADYMRRIKQLKDSTDSEDWKRFEQTIALFEKYGKKYRFDPLMLAAQGYQESGLNQNDRSPIGAIGIMQIMPKTGSELAVGDIRIKEPNIHAGAKYMDHLIAQYFSNADFSEMDRTLFAFASYNCGPGNVLKMRRLAEQRSLDPNMWFNHVEVVTAEKIGMEPTTYVRNIYKYYTAYKLMTDTTAKQRDARKSTEKNAN